MTSLAYSDYSGTLVKPPVRTPVPPDQGIIPGQAPAAGAGSVAVPPPPVLDPSVPLPFGNGVTPDGDLSNTNISPTGPTTFNGGPQILGSPTGGPAILGSPNSGPEIQGAPPSGSPILGSPTGGAAVLPGNDPRLAGARAMLDKSTGDLANTDRRSMLSSLLNDFDTQSAERDDNAYTQVGRRDAALGRLGSGMTSGALGSIARQSARDKQQFRNQLAQDTIGAEISDRFGKANLFRGLAGDEYGYGQGDRNELRGERGYADNRKDRYLDDMRGERGYFDNRGDQYRQEARGERGYRDNRGDQYRDEARGERGYADNRGDQYRQDARGERSWQYGVGRDNYNNAQDYRNELRGERGYQDQREAYGTDRGIEQAKLSDYLTGSAFDRNRERYGIGSTGSPYAGSNYGTAAADAQGQSDSTMQSLMLFLQSLGLGG